MADIHNPLNNPGAEPVRMEQPPAREEPPEANEELEGFLDDFFEGTPQAVADIEPPETSAPPGQERPAAEPAPVAPAQAQQARRDPPSAEASTQQPAPVGDAPVSQDDLQREVLQSLKTQLERMNQPAQPEPERPQPITPDQLVQQLQPRVQQYVEAGWLTEDHAMLYPRETALQVYMWDQLQQGTQQLQQTQEFTRGEQERRSQEQVSQTLNSAMDEVAARGEVFGALADTEVRNGFREFLINEVNPRVSQLTPDFLSRQFYAYNHQLILDTVRQGQAGQPAAQGEPTAAQLASQEGASARGSQVTPQQPEFIDMLEGMAAANWYQ